MPEETPPPTLEHVAPVDSETMDEALAALNDDGAGPAPEPVVETPPAAPDTPAPATPAPVSPGTATESTPAAPETPQDPPAPLSSLPPDVMIKRLVEQDKQLRETNTKLKQLQQSGPGLERFQEQARTDVLGTLNSLGIGIDQVIDAYSAGPATATPEQATPAMEGVPAEAQQYIQNLQQQYQSQQDTLSEMQKMMRQQAFFREHDRVAALASGDNSDRWELVRLTGDEAIDMTIRVADQIRQQEGRVPPYAEVLDRVESHLLDRDKAAIERRRGSKKLGGYFSGQPAAAAPAATPAAAPATGGNGLPPSTTGDTPAPKEMTDEEIMALAVKELDKE